MPTDKELKKEQNRRARRNARAALRRKSHAERKAFREQVAKKYREWRIRNPERHNAYMRNYWKENPVMREAHQIRIDLAKFRMRGDKKITVSDLLEYGYFPSELTEHLDRLAMKRGHTEFNKSNFTIEHVVTITLFIEFGCHAKSIINDISNIEILTRAENSRKQGFITEDVVAKAIELEQKYPNELNGFIAFVLDKQLTQRPRDVV